MSAHDRLRALATQASLNSLHPDEQAELASAALALLTEHDAQRFACEALVDAMPRCVDCGAHATQQFGIDCPFPGWCCDKHLGSASDPDAFAAPLAELVALLEKAK